LSAVSHQQSAPLRKQEAIRKMDVLILLIDVCLPYKLTADG